MQDPLSGLLVEAEVRSQAARTLMKLFDSLYEGAVVVDRQARVTFINDKYKALLGWNGVEPVEGRPVEEIIPDSQMRRVVETGQADLLDVFTIARRQVVVSRIPLTDGEGRVVGAIGLILYDRLQALKPIVSKFQKMQDDLAHARRELADNRRAKYGLSQFVGASEPARALKAQALRAAGREVTVLLLGETGTGKELLAHAIHAASARAAKPMVRVNAAAIPEALLEAELFGAVPGAYTGAGPKARPGKFELAEGGTLFLDEVGDMPLSLQVKLLRVLQEREIEPLGSNRVVPVDVRVIAATSRDLKAMVEAGSFRADLYYRLNVLPIALPPLRARLSDIGALCEALLEKRALEAGGRLREIAPEAVQRLGAHHWPGNVRELGNVLEQAAAREEDGPITAAHLDGLIPAAPSLAVMPAAAPGLSLREAVARAEREAILRALAASGGVKLHAARLLGISRAQFYEKLAAHGLLSDPSDTQQAV